MPTQGADKGRKLAAFFVMVAASLGGIVFFNWASIRDEGGFVTGEPDDALGVGLRQLYAAPGDFGMTALVAKVPSSVVRTAQIPLMSSPRVLLLGRSDANHMSSVFFRDPSAFHNGILEDGSFSLDYDYFRKIVAAHGPPRLVLVDLALQHLQELAKEPALGEDVLPSTSWFTQIPSLLASDQTIGSLRHLQLVWNSWRHGTGDWGRPFRVSAANAPCPVYRWRKDGSRLYPGESGDDIGPSRGVIEETKRIVEHDVSPERLRILRQFLERLQADGTRVIAYTPPVGPKMLEAHPEQRDRIGAMDAPVRAAVTAAGVGYCNLALEAASVGCSPADFFDAHHVSRRCSGMVMKRLASACGGSAADVLRSELDPGFFDGLQ